MCCWYEVKSSYQQVQKLSDALMLSSQIGRQNLLLKSFSPIKFHFFETTLPKSEKFGKLQLLSLKQTLQVMTTELS